jgi:4-alpha-glucanotransferase
MTPLHDLADAAGIQRGWRDVNGNDKSVSDASLRAVLAALGLAADTDADIADSRATLAREAAGATPPLVTADAGRPFTLQGQPGPYKLTLESGAVINGTATADGGQIHLPAIAEPGYHRLELGDAPITIATAPPCAYTLEDAGGGAKMFGLAVQLYALRRAGDGGIGDFAALAEFVRAAAAHGADAVAISPVHAQFAGDVTRYGPYAPSNRAALNVLHIPRPTAAPDEPLINWPVAAAAKLTALRAAYGNFQDHAALQKFREEAGPGLENHAIFEAITETLLPGNPAAADFRTWPPAYASPGSPAVAKFVRDNPEKIGFHAWLQYQADAGLAAAQKAARDAGQKIGLIADLAVGTDHSGSASWSRQDEILRDLEIGAPPDLINREGQSWGISAFSPRGLRKSGFAAFLDMLRHALRHAGGVRIDHVMGLARLWVVPQGMKSADGAYLTLPVDDLMRLVILESTRHRAVILGEDLGTLPHGFSEKLNAAGIAGLRVMWFERGEKHFSPPSHWTRTAVAMTTTHDLPTVAGWWQGEDIKWREKLAMAGDDETIRAQDRAELWKAFQASGATTAPQPPPSDGAAVTYAACAHLGRAGSLLALLPVEDALSLADQPNRPGTVDEHPNWRRRLPGDAETIFGREDVAARLDVLKKARTL